MFVVFEGIDRSGKETQSKLFYNYLTQTKSYRAFPDYTTDVGKLIRQVLNGYIYRNQYEINMLFSLNRYEHKMDLESDLENLDHLIIDRYYYSNWAYGHFREKIDEEWLRSLDSELPKPDLVFLIDTPVDVTIKRKLNHDVHEVDRNFQQRARDKYLEIVDELDNFVVIPGNRAIDSIHKDVVREFESRVKS